MLYVEAVIAVVDDTPENVNVLRGLLTQAAYKVLCFTNAEAALKAFGKRQPDLVLMDVNMPGLNGFEACQRMKADENLKNIPVIFISAASDTQDVIQGFAVGGSDYIAKPFRAEEVLARVKTHVANAMMQTSLQKSYDQVLQLESMRESLVQMIVHDIRSPLTVVRGFADMCGKRMEMGHSPQMTDIQRIAQAAKRMGSMIEDILQVNQIEAAGLELNGSHFNLSTECYKLIEDYKAIHTKHHLVLSLPDEHQEVKADKAIVLRIIENLLNNALKFTPEGGTIELSIRPGETGAVTVSINDEGPGVPDEDKEKIFDKYCQLSATDSRYKGSVGLGLTFCKMAVEAHGGAIGVCDNQPGGSRFWITLPTQLEKEEPTQLQHEVPQAC